MGLFIQALHLIIMPLTFIRCGKRYRVLPEKKKHLLDCVGDKEVKNNKLNKFFLFDSWITVKDFLHLISTKWHNHIGPRDKDWLFIDRV